MHEYFLVLEIQLRLTFTFTILQVTPSDKQYLWLSQEKIKRSVLISGWAYGIVGMVDEQP